MKQTITIFSLVLMTMACGGKTEKKEAPASDDAIATEMIQEIESEKEELSKTSQETLTEVDSLLENL